jgi:predicted DNA-binding transcriptional regulator AlpA
MASRLLNYRDLVAMGVVGNRQTLSRWTRLGTFPAGFHTVEGGARRWTEESVAQWLSTRPAAEHISRPFGPPPKRKPFAAWLSRLSN